MRRKHGFTLIELIAVITVMGILAVAVTPVLIHGVDAYTGAATTAQTLDKLNYATERIAREIREANPGTLNMNTAAPSFTRNDYAGTALTVRTVAIASANGQATLAYTPPGVTAVLTDQVDSLTFAYFDRNGASTTLVAEVRFVEVVLTLAQGGQTLSHTTRVALRN